MVVAVQKGLTDIFEGLRERGFETVWALEYPYPIDALVYQTGDLATLSFTNGNYQEESAGILMINAKNKTLEELCRALEHRTADGYGLFD